MEDETKMTEFEEAMQADMMVNALIKIAMYLERMLTAIYVSAGLLGLISIILMLRWWFDVH